MTYLDYVKFGDDIFKIYPIYIFLQNQDTHFWHSLKKKPFLIKFSNWEYWPIWLANSPVILFVIWFALRARKVGFFAAANPAIETGGLFGESKINILHQIPEKYLPKTIFVKKNTDFALVKKAVADKQITYPLIAKPNIGERGLLVAKIKEENDLAAYLNRNHIDFIVQEFVDLPIELAVMHHRFPNKKRGQITSICVKELLQVTGNGNATVRELMLQTPRALLQLPRFEKQFADLMKSVPKKGEILELEPIGNHSRGTAFLNGNHLITEKMTAVFDEVSNKMGGIFYGRFDMKCASSTAMERGDFKILEYNGVGAEPAHIYDASIPIWQKYRDIYRHWRLIFQIYQVQKKRGITGNSIFELRGYWKKYTHYIKNIHQQ